MSKTILLDGNTLETKGSVRLNPITIKKLGNYIPVDREKQEFGVSVGLKW